MSAPYVKGSETSREAAEKIEPVKYTMQDRIVVFASGAQSTGVTVDEVERFLGMLHQSAGARVRELVLAGKLVDSEQTRKTRSGRNAVVWCLPQYGPRPETPENLDLFGGPDGSD